MITRRKSEWEHKEMEGLAEVWKMCWRKRPFKNRKAALRAVTADKVRAYRCPHCRMWHRTKLIQVVDKQYEVDVE